MKILKLGQKFGHQQNLQENTEIQIYFDLRAQGDPKLDVNVFVVIGDGPWTIPESFLTIFEISENS